MIQPRAEVCHRGVILMDTLVSIDVVDSAGAERWNDAIDRAFGWFRAVEDACSRFDPSSEVMGLSRRVGEPVEVSPLLFEAARFAVEVARLSGGAFDPTIGQALERRGFNRNYRTGQRIASNLAAPRPVSWRNVALDPARRTVTLRAPLVLDLGAVAKGLAIDLAARELSDCPGFAVDAGGDLYVHGMNPDGTPWRVGIRHPRQPEELLAIVAVSDLAVCTSGDYERLAEDPGDGHHLVDPRSGASVRSVASVTSLAPTAMLADALGTAAFVLGPEKGRRFLERQGIEGLLVTPSLEWHATRGFQRYCIYEGI